MRTWNGVSMLREYRPRRADFEIWMDVSGSFGCGAVWGKRWLQAEWSKTYAEAPQEWGEDGITLKELVPIIMSCAIWGPQWRQSSILVHCDNEGAVAVVNSGYSRVEKIMHLLRCLFFIRAQFGMEVRAVHVPGKDNILADAISHNNLSVLSLQMPEVESKGEAIPEELVKLLLKERPDWTSASWSRLFTSCFHQD